MVSSKPTEFERLLTSSGRVELEKLVAWCSGTDRGHSELVALLDERSSLYVGRGASQVARLRGCVLAAFERVGTPRGALPFILEELENGIRPYLVAAAARAVRGLHEPSPKLVPVLLQAVRNIRYRDDALSFEHAEAGAFAGKYTTAVEEILNTLRWMGATVAPFREDLESLADGRHVLSPSAHASLRRIIEDLPGASVPKVDCCEPTSLLAPAASRPTRSTVPHVMATDQNGDGIALFDLLSGHASLMAFFYSRCDNPNKCSLTVTRLASLQARLQRTAWGRDVSICAITYDPGFDTPALLKTYGRHRGFRFSEQARFLRIEPRQMPAFGEALGLGVSYAGSIVSHHRIELYVVDPLGRITKRFERLRWNEDDVLEALRETHGARVARMPRGLLKALGHMNAVAAPIALCLAPKCPICVAAYLSALGTLGVTASSFAGWLRPVLWVLVGVNLFVLLRRARQSRAWFPLSLAGLGALLLVFDTQFRSAGLATPGAGLLVLASVLLVFGTRRRTDRAALGPAAVAESN